MAGSHTPGDRKSAPELALFSMYPPTLHSLLNFFLLLGNILTSTKYILIRFNEKYLLNNKQLLNEVEQDMRNC